MNVLGFEYGLQEKLYRTPQDCLNTSVAMLGKTKISTVNITEFMNSMFSTNSDGLTTYDAVTETTNRKKQKAKFLKDTLIMAYSNSNMSGFLFSGYLVENDNSEYLNKNNSASVARFSDEEKDVYQKFIKGDYFNDGMDLLKLSTNVGYENGTYNTRIYNNSIYTITVSYNGKTYTKKNSNLKSTDRTIDIIVD